MTSTNDGKDVKSNQTSVQKGKTYYIELYKSLEAGLSSECKLRERTKFLCEAWRRVYLLCHHSVPSTQAHLLSWLQRHTYRTLLQTEWQSPTSKDEHTKLDEAISAFISECQNEEDSKKAESPLWQRQLVQRGQWFQKILDNPWGHPVLKRLLDSHGDSPTDDEVLEWLKEERAVMFLTRLRQLAASKCEDLALSLASNVMDRVRADVHVVADADQLEDSEDKPNSDRTTPTFAEILKTEAGFTAEVWQFLTDLEFVLLLKRDKRSQCIQLAKLTPLRNGCKLVERLHSRLEASPREKKLWKNAKEVATLIAQVVVTRCMVVRACSGSVRSALYCMGRVLARTLAPRRLRAEAATLAAPAATARHLHTLAAAVRAELQDTKEMIPFMCELYVRAITAGMNELERLKLKTEMETEARSAEQTLASWFTQLGSLLYTSDRIQCECTLTAFSVHPSPAMYEKIKAAPTLPPVALDHLEPKEETISDFGSWANDSRSMTNLVKTSETLNLKQTLHQANVLSTAILTEGEGLGLDPDMCQDIAVLLSGPRLKTLSWDMDRELLLENCRAYMERTSGGTRAVTTELKYLNLDPKAFQHLPVEEDDENDMFYGIEKGYEHLVEFQEPEEMWDAALSHPEMVDSPYASCAESEISTIRRKKKNKKVLKSSDEDSDPLSFMAEAKRKEKKKVRPHSKERSKERRKKKSERDPLGSRDGSQESIKESSKKEKKKERKARKKKDCSQPKPSSLARLVGMKVTKLDDKYSPSMTDSDYDSQGKSSLNSLNSEGTEDVVFDGLYSMDELKSPEHVQNDKMGLMKNNEFSITDGIVAVNKPANLNIQDIGNNAMPSYSLDAKAKSTVLDMTSQPYLSSVREEVKKSISRLIEFRRNKKLLDSMGAVPTSTSTTSGPNASVLNYKIPSAIVRPESPLPAQISPKIVTIPDIPKMYINKKQSEQLTKLKNEVNRYLNTSNNVNSTYSAIQFGQPDVERNKIQNFAAVKPSNPSDPVADLIRQHSKHIKKIPPKPAQINMVSETIRHINHAPNIPTVQNVSKPVNSTGNLKEKSFQEFLKELQETINAGAGVHSSDKVPPVPNIPPRKEIRPMSRPTPVIPVNMKIDNKTTASAKTLIQPKKLDTSLNTFSRLSYMHKNKCDTKLHQLVNALIEHQDENLKKIPPSRVIDRLAIEQKVSRSKCPQVKMETTSRPIKSVPQVKLNNNVLNKKYEKPSTFVNPTTKTYPVSSILQNNNASSFRSAEIKNDMHTKIVSQPQQVRHEPTLSSLSEKDQNDLLLLLRQQNKLNASYSTDNPDSIRNKDGHKAHIAQNSTLSNVTSTKFHTSADLPLCNKDMKVSKPFIYESYKPKKPPILTGVKVQNYTNAVSKPSVSKTANTSRNHSKVQSHSLERNAIKNIEIKTDKLHSKNDAHVITKTATDWERVMDAILAQKTPSRGPKALDVALNKSSFAKAFSDSLQSQKLLKSNSMEELIGNNVTDSKIVSSSKEASGIFTAGNKNNQNTHSSVPKKAPSLAGGNSSCKSSIDSKQNSKSSHSKILGNSTNSAHVSTSQSHSAEVSRKPNSQEPHRKLLSEELKKQFTCPLPKDDDPFISGIANSDYDLLEELMDDDLRQEIGELSTDEDDYNPSAPNVSKRKNIVTEKRVPEAYSKLANATPMAVTAAMDLCTNNIRESKKITVQIPSLKSDDKVESIYGTPKQPDSGCNNTKKITSSGTTVPLHENDNNSTPIRNEHAITTDKILPTLDSSNLYITAAPKQRYQNVVVINTDLVYDPYPAVQPSINSTVNSIKQNSYVSPPSNKPPSPNKTLNTALYQTAEFTTPVVSPLIIGNCVTTPMTVTKNEIIASVTTPRTMFNKISNVYKSVDATHSAESNANYSKPDLTCMSVSHRPSNDNLLGNKIALDLNSNKNCKTEVMSKVQEQKLLSNIVPEKDTKESTIAKESSSNENEDQERLTKKRMSIINRKLSHRCDNEPIPLSFAPLDSGAYSTYYSEQSLMENNHTVSQNECVPKIAHQLETMLNTNTVNLQNDKTNELNASTVIENNYSENKTLESDCRRILLRSSNKLDQSIFSKQNNSKNTNHSKTYTSKKEDVSSDNITSVNQCEEKQTPKPRPRKRAPKKDHKPNKNERQQESKERKKKEKVSKKAKAVVKNLNKNKKSLQKMTTSTNLDFLDIEDELLGSKIPRIFGSDDTTLPNESVIDKIIHIGSSTELLNIGGLEEHVHKEPKPVETELFDDLTQFSCDTVSFENIIKEKALLSTDFHKENVASPIPVLTSNDIETVLEKEKVSTKNILSLKESISMNLNMTSSRATSENCIEVKEPVRNAATSPKMQPDVSTFELDEDNTPFFKQVISQIEMSKVNEQRQVTGGAKQNPISDKIEKKEIPEHFKQKQLPNEVECKEITKEVQQNGMIKNVNQKEIFDNVGRQEITKEIKQQQMTHSVKRQKNSEKDKLKRITEQVDQKQITSEVKRQEVAEEVKQKPTIDEVNKKQIGDDRKQNELGDVQHKQIDDEVEKTPVTGEVHQKQIMSGVAQTQVEDKVSSNTSIANQSYLKINNHKNNSVISNDSVVNLVDDIQSEESSSKSTSSTANVNIEPKIPQSYKDSIKIEQIPSGSNDPMKKCLRIKLPNGRTFKATVHGRVLLNVDALFEEPALKSLLLSSLTDKKFYTLNIKQVSTASADNPNKIVETRIQEVNIEPKTAPNLVETINLLSDDEDEDVFQYFKTEFGQYKIRPLSNRLFSSHQKKFNQNCRVDLMRLNLTTLDESIYVSNYALFKTIFNKDPTYPEKISPTKRKLRQNPIPTKKMSALMQEAEVIQIDDSSNESFVDIETCESEVYNDMQEVSGDQITGLNMNCYIKLIRCDDLVKKYNTLKALNQKCYVDLVRIDSSNLQYLISHDLNVGHEEDNQFQLPLFSEKVTNGRTSPVMEAYELIARSYNKTNEILEICQTKQYNKQDAYVCKSFWLETKRIFSELAIKSNAPSNNAIRQLQLVNVDLNKTLLRRNNQLFSPPDLKVLMVKHFQNSLALDYTYLSRSTNITNFHPSRTISFLLKRKLKSDHNTVCKKRSKLNTVSIIRRNKNQLNEAKRSNISINYEEDQEMISMETTIRCSEENVLLQNGADIEMDSIKNYVKENKIIDPNIDSEKLNTGADQENERTHIVASDKLQLDLDNTKSNNHVTENSTIETLGIHLQSNKKLDKVRDVTKSVLDTKDSAIMGVDLIHLKQLDYIKNVNQHDHILHDFIHTDVKSGIRNNCITIHESILKNRNDLVDIELSNKNTNNPVSNYTDNNHVSTDTYEIDEGIKISNYNCTKKSSESENTIIKVYELKATEQNAIQTNQTDPVVHIKEENIDNDKLSQNEKRDTLTENYDDRNISIQKKPGSISNITQELEFLEPNTIEENNTNPVHFTEDENSYLDNLSVKEKHCETSAENCDNGMHTPDNLIETSNSDSGKSYSDPRNANEKVPIESRKAEYDGLIQNRKETVVLTKNNNDQGTCCMGYEHNNMSKIPIEISTYKWTVAYSELENTTAKSAKDIEKSGLNAISEEGNNDYHQTYGVMAEKPCNDIFIPSKPIEIETHSEYDKIITNMPKELEENHNTIDENDIYAKNKDCQETSIDTKHCDNTLLKSFDNNSCNEHLKTIEYMPTKTYLEMKNMIDETQNELELTVRNFTENKSNTSEKSNNERDMISEPLETLDYKITKSFLGFGNIIAIVQEELETIVPNVDVNKIDMREQENGDRHETSIDVKCDSMIDNSDSETYTTNEPLEPLDYEVIKNHLESECTIAKIQETLESNIPNVDENKINLIQKENCDSDDTVVEVKYCDIVTKQSKNDTDDSNKTVETMGYEITHMVSENMISDAHNLVSTVENTTVNKNDIKENEYNNRNENIFDMKHLETVEEISNYDSTNKSENFNREFTEIHLESENIIADTQEELTTTAEDKTTNILENKVNRNDNYIDVKHFEIVVESSDDDLRTNTNEAFESLIQKMTTSHSESENNEVLETTNQNTIKENKTDVTEKENNDHCVTSKDQKTLATVVESSNRVKNTNGPLKTLDCKNIELYSELGKSIEKAGEEFGTIVQNNLSEQKCNDLAKPSPDIRNCEIEAESRVNDTLISMKNIGQDYHDFFKVQNIMENDYEEKHAIFSNLEQKKIIIGDHDYVGDLLMGNNEYIETSKCENGSLENSETEIDSIRQEITDNDYIMDDTVFNVLMPKNTYKRNGGALNRIISYERKSKRIVKRKRDMTDFKFKAKRYRKGKNIDTPKCHIAPDIDTTYYKEYKGLINYNSAVKFSYSRPFHKEHIEVHELLKNWPITNATVIENQSEKKPEELLFLDLDNIEKSNNQKLQSLAEELLCKDALISNYSDDIKETNFNMGFGERSGRVILNLEDGVYVSEVTAATLSDVKQNQPVLQSENKNIFLNSQSSVIYNKTKNDLIEGINLYNTSVQLKNKVKDFFNKSAIELNLMQDYGKGNKDCGENDMMELLFGLNFMDFINPPPVEITVQVVQVGQLPVSAAAQNPVTCDPRVTQVSDASPPQCSAENSPHDDHQMTIKTEYTELTTADINLPMVHEYEHHEQLVQYERQESSNIPIINENIPIQTEIKSVVKIELMEEEEKMEPNEMLDHNECDTPDDEIVNNMDYSFEVNNANATPEPPPNMEMMYNDTIKQCNGTEEFSPLPQQNGFTEKTDQIAHAMNAAGISTTAETLSNSETTDDHDYNTLSQNVKQDATLPNGSELYSKTTSINAMALQQALAHILPPLNQSSSTENNPQSSNAVTSQVLHIVQGKNASVNQVTLVDNAQPSVINTPNATPVLHIVQNKSATTGASSTGAPTTQSNTFSGLSLVDAALQKGGNQLLHIVNAGNQNNNNNTGQLLKRVNLLTNLTNAQGGNEQKMVQFVCKSADGKPIQLNASHQRSMVLRLQPVETPTIQTNPQKSTDNLELSPTHNINSNSDSSQEIKSRSVYEENYAKFIQGGSAPGSEKATSLPKFNQAFGKQVFQEEKQNELNGNSHLSSVSSDGENPECQSQDHALNMEHLRQINSPPLLLRKSPSQPTQTQQNIVQQIKETIAPMNIQTMHGGVIYTRQIPVNIGGGQTINLITVPTTELVDESGQKQQTEVKFVNQSGIEPSIIKIVPQTQPTSNGEASQENNSHSGANENNHNAQSQPVLTQMRIKLPMLSKAPNVVSGTRVIRPSFFHIQRNVISGGANQQVYQQLVLTAAPPLGQQTIRLPQVQNARPQKTPENQSTSESQMSTSTLEQLREFDLVLEQVKERSTVQPNGSTGAFSKINTSSTDTTDGTTNASSTTTEPTQQQVLYSIGNTQPLNVAYVNRKTPVPTPTTSTYVRSPDSSGIIDSSTSSSSSQASTSHTITTEARTNDPPPQPKKSHKSKSRPKASSNPPNTLKLNTTPPKPSSQKPLEDEQTTQRILYILAEYKEQVENSPDKDKPAPRRRNNPPTTPSGSSKRKKSSGSRRHGPRDMSPIHGDETCRTMGSEDSSCGTSLGDCNESCIDSHSPQDSPRKVIRKLTFDHEPQITPPRPQPQRNVIVADGQTITVARGTAGKPTTAVLMPANYILPVSMVKGGQQIAIVTNRGPKLLTVSSGGEGGTTNALLLQRLIGPAGLKPMLARPGFRHLRLPAAALHNLQTFNLTTATSVPPPDSTASPAPAPTPPDLIETRAASSPWTERESQEVKPERGSSPEDSEPWNLHTVDPHDYSYEETVRTENLDRTVLVVHKREGHRQHRLTHVSAAALRHKYAILEHELRLQKSLSEECEDLGVDSPSASELFPEAELLFTASPAHDHAQDHSHPPQPIIHIPKPDLEDQIASDRVISRDMHDRSDLNLGLEDVGIVTVSEDGLQTTIALNQEEFARAHPNTTFHSEPSDEVEVQPFTITGLKSRHITSTIFHGNRTPGTVLVTAPQTTVISQATAEPATTPNVKYVIDNMIDSLPGAHNSNINLPSVLVKDDGLSRFDSLLAESREGHNTTSAIVRSSGNATQVIRRVCFDDDKREKDGKYLIDEPDAMMAGDDTNMEDISRDAALGPVRDDVEDRSSPERHSELFWDSSSMAERMERRRRLDFSSDSDKCCKSPTFDENNSDSGVGVHMRLDSVIKEARVVERTSIDGPSEENHPPLRTYPPKRLYHNTETEIDRSLSGKTRAGVRSPDMMEVRRRASVRGVVKRGCHCCNGSPAPPRPKKPRPRKPTMDFTANN